MSDIETSESKIIFRMTFSGVEKDALMFLVKHHDFDDPKKLIRFLIAKANEKIKDKQLTYGKGPSDLQARKARENETLKELRAMSGEQLLAFILEVGYIKDHEEDGDFISHSIIQEGDNMILMCEKRKKPGDEPFSRFSIHDNLDQIIKGLQKDKLI